VRYCEEENCSKQANFGYAGTRPTRCKDHRLENQEDVKNIRCKHPPCSTRANFGLYGKRAEFCVIHKSDEHVDLTNKKCSEKGCTKRANFGSKTSTEMYCLQHKSSHHEDITHPMCKVSDCRIRATPPFHYCSTHDTLNKRPTRVRENRVKNALIDAFGISTYQDYQDDIRLVSNDRQVRTVEPNSIGCEGERTRPDFVLTKLDRVCVVECDEDQHENYGKACEERRIVDIINGLGVDRISFIRFNPDPFKYKGRTWPTSWSTRIKILLNVIRKRMSEELQPGEFTIDMICFDCPDSCNGECERVHRGMMNWESGNMVMNVS
jgi:hypothetical protein